MKIGHLVHRTRAGRVAVRPDLLPELMAWLGMRKVQARRAINAATADVLPGAEKWAAATADHYRKVERVIDYLTRTIVDTIPETDFDIVHSEAKSAIGLLLASGIPVGGLRPEVPSCVAGLSVTGGRRGVRPRDDNPSLPAWSGKAVGGGPERDNRAADGPTTTPEPGGPGERRKHRRNAGRGGPGGTKAGKG